jgi:hypothetical protein
MQTGNLGDYLYYVVDLKHLIPGNLEEGEPIKKALFNV